MMCVVSLQDLHIATRENCNSMNNWLTHSKSKLFTKNMHVHLCLAPVCRLCARVICAMRVQVRRAWHVLRFAVGEASCLVFVVSKPRWPRCTVVPDLHLHRQRTPSSVIYLSRAYLNVSDYVMHIWPIPRPCLWYVTTFRMTFLSVTHRVRTYSVRIDPWFRASR